MTILPGEQLKRVHEAERIRAISREYAQRPNPNWKAPKEATPSAQQTSVYKTTKHSKRKSSLIIELRQIQLERWVVEHLERTIAGLSQITDFTEATRCEQAVRQSLDRLRGIKAKFLKSSKTPGEGTSKPIRDNRPARGRRDGTSGIHRSDRSGGLAASTKTLS